MRFTRRMLLLILFLGVIMLPTQKEIYSSLDSTTNFATRFLNHRPESTRTHDLTLTLVQLVSFRDHVFELADRTINDLHDVDADEILRRKAIIEMDLVGLNEAEFNRNFDKYYQLYEDLFTLYSLTLESRSVEGRGVWHRPFEADLAMVRQTLQGLNDLGINMLFLETFWMGRLIYRSDVPYTYQHAFTLGGYRDDSVDYGTNLLLAFVEEAKVYDIEIHAWVENFFVGFGTNVNGSPILQARPEWSQLNHDGTLPQKFETNYLFMDPANPEVREYLKNIYVEMAGIDGVASIHLDYIRYPVNTNPRSPTNNGDTGYSAIAEREFMSLYGYSGDLRQLVVENAQAAKDWQEYKTQNISMFVAGVYHRIKTHHPEVYLSTAIFGNVNNAIQTKNQDWQSWIDDGYIEMILPMAYYQSSLTVRNESINLNRLVGLNAFSYVGIAPSYMGFNDHLNTTQIQASLDAKAQGVTFFATQNYMLRHFNGVTPENSKVISILQNGVFRQPSILPHQDLKTVLEVSLAEMLDRSQRIYVPHEAMTVNQKNALAAVFNDWQSRPLITQEDLGQLIETIETFEVSTLSSGNATLRLQEALDYLIMLLQIRHIRNRIDATIDLSQDPDIRPQLPPLEMLQSPQNIRIEGPMIRWDEVPTTSNFRVYINGQPFDTETNEFDLRSINLFEGSLTISVKSLGNNVLTIDSQLSLSIEHTISRTRSPGNLRIHNDVLTFDEVPGAVAYQIRVGTLTFTIEDNQFNLNEQNLASQEYALTVVALGDNYQSVNSLPSSSLRYRAQDLRIQNRFKTVLKELAKTIVTSGE